MDNNMTGGQMFHFDFLNLLASDRDGNEKIKTCIQCGSCTGSCVAADGIKINPRKLWRGIQLGMEDEVMEGQNFWNCTTCGLCDKRCPRGIPMSQIMLSLREKFDANGAKNDGTVSGAALNGVAQTMENLKKSRNITGDDNQNRFLWLDNLVPGEEERKKLLREKSKTVYFTGCVGALFPQVGGIPQSLTRLLLKLGDDFTLLNDEWCCGYPILAGGKGRAGMAEYAAHNISQIELKGAETVLVSCPTCYYVFTKIYPELSGNPLSFKVLHYSEYLEEVKGIGTGERGLVTREQVIGSGELGVGAKAPDAADKKVIVTYHDPCDLGRKLHITEAPRKLLAGIAGVDFREMRFSGEEGKCCGGGGNLEMVNAELSFSIAVKRINDAMETGAEYLLSSCQQCKRTLQNAARKSRLRIKVMDINEFILTRLEEAEK